MYIQHGRCLCYTAVRYIYCGCSMSSRIFFPCWPWDSFSMIARTRSVACASLSFAGIVTISCSGSFNYQKQKVSINDLSDSRGQLSTFMSTSVRISASLSPLVLPSYQRDIQKPCAVRFLKINSDVGSSSGRFDMAPYDTMCASAPRSFAMLVVVAPPTQLRNSRRGGAPDVSCAMWARRALLSSSAW